MSNPSRLNGCIFCDLTSQNPSNPNLKKFCHSNNLTLNPNITSVFEYGVKIIISYNKLDLDLAGLQESLKGQIINRFESIGNE